MSYNDPKTPDEIISTLKTQLSCQISKFETTLFHRHLKSIGFAQKYDAEVDITSWSNNQDSYITSHLGIISFVVFEPGKNVLDINDSDSKEDDEILTSDALTEDELKQVIMRLAGGIASTGSIPTTKGSERVALDRLPVSSWQAHDQEPVGALQLKPSMFVRVPNPSEYGKPENLAGYRDFWLGKVNSINPMANACQVLFEFYEADGKTQIISAEYDLDHISRICILPNTEVLLDDGTQCELLCPTMEPEDGKYISYFLLVEDHVVTKPEYAIMAKFHMQDSEPTEQLRNYEFHNPSFKFPRDQIVESYAELQGTTLGLDDLVGSRVRLMAHQAEVITKVLSDDECRYVLADEVGLGKTIEACVILRGIKQNHEELTTLIVVPESLISQWHFELDSKFWLDFPIVTSLAKLWSCQPGDGFIVSTELLQQASDNERKRLLTMAWGMLIVDEAHHIHKLPVLYDTLHSLSKQAKRTLLLSATPIQRQAIEFLSLLKLMDPARYDGISTETYRQILDAQEPILDAVLEVRDYMSPAEFDAEEFVEIFRELDPYIEDKTIDLLLKEIENAPSTVIQRYKALETLAYLSDNYRVETRILRNRRAALDIVLSTRTFDNRYAYTPNMRETTLFNDVYEYLSNLYTELSGIERQMGLEYVRIVLNALFSSPEALREVLTLREQAITQGVTVATVDDSTLLNPAAPRREMARIRLIAGLFRSLGDEANELERLLRDAEILGIDVDEALKKTRFAAPNHPYRFAQVIQAIKDLFMKQAAGKVVLFSSWDSTLTALLLHLKRSFRHKCKIVEFRCGMDEEALQESAEKFQSTDDHNILICDELGGEGRNFQIADLIIHVDLPWTPAQIEQRIGRVDRLGRTGTVRSILPYTKEQVEADLFAIWEDGFSLFSKSMSGMEIALEDILSELKIALGESIVDGLVELKEPMKRRAADIRERVDKEAYYNDVAVDRQRRQTFQMISERYRDGTILGRAFKKWSNQIGLQNSYNAKEDIVYFYPKQFKHKMMQNAHYIQPPNMEEALVRSKRTHNLILKGTFNRDKAVIHEELIFYSPGSDNWTESILKNAFQSDRGRCCAVLRRSDQVAETWSGFEFFYRLQIDPRPLYWSGFAPIHISLAQEYLPLNSYRLLISEDGEVLPQNHSFYKITRKPHSYQVDTHLGKRSGKTAELDAFKMKYPRDVWVQIVNRAIAAAESHMSDEVMDEYGFDIESDEAYEKFARRLNGKRAAIRWRHRANKTDPTIEIAETDIIEQLYGTLVDGIAKPWIRIESATYWLLQPTKG